MDNSIHTTVSRKLPVQTSCSDSENDVIQQFQQLFINVSDYGDSFPVISYHEEENGYHP